MRGLSLEIASAIGRLMREAGSDERRYAIPEMLECQLWRQVVHRHMTDRKSIRTFPATSRTACETRANPSSKIETDDFETELPHWPCHLNRDDRRVNRTRQHVTNSGFILGIARHAWKRNGVDPVGTSVSTLQRSSVKITLSSAARETESLFHLPLYIKPDTSVIYVTRIRDFA